MTSIREAVLDIDLKIDYIRDTYASYVMFFHHFVLLHQGGAHMLVLSRKVNEEIVIADNIRIKLVKIAGGRARLGISAPENVGIRRAELPPNPQSQPGSGVIPNSGSAVPTSI